MTKMERVQMALRGEPVDRTPVSCWGHNYLKEWSAEGLAEAMLDVQQTYEWDYMKVNPRASYHVEDWGVRLAPSGSPTEGPSVLDWPVRGPGDWSKLQALDPEQGVLGEQLRALALIAEGLRGEVPFVQTVFSPLAIASYLVGKRPEDLLFYVRETPEQLHRGLEKITETFRAYVPRCLERGAAGIFFATTGWASYDRLSAREYVEFGRSYDLQVLEKAQDGAWFNILHNCGANIMFDMLEDYPVQAINWSLVSEGTPSLSEALAKTRKAVMGGLGEKTTLKHGSVADVAAEARDALTSAGCRRFLLAPGCSIPPDVPEANLRAVKQAVEEYPC